jgi:hypothetical protein
VIWWLVDHYHFFYISGISSPFLDFVHYFLDLSKPFAVLMNFKIIVWKYFAILILLLICIYHMHTIDILWYCLPSQECHIFLYFNSLYLLQGTVSIVHTFCHLVFHNFVTNLKGIFPFWFLCIYSYGETLYIQFYIFISKQELHGYKFISNINIYFSIILRILIRLLSTCKAMSITKYNLTSRSVHYFIVWDCILNLFY